MTNLTIIPDSSFYICFLDDIKKPNILIRLFNATAFQFTVGPLIKEEIKKSINFKMIKLDFEARVRPFEYYSYGEILRPVFSVDEISRGEQEVIAVAYVLHLLSVNFLAILDDAEPNKIVKSNFPQISVNFVGTIGFVSRCYSVYEIFSKMETSMILDLIKDSRFRVDKKILNEEIERIKAS